MLCSSCNKLTSAQANTPKDDYGILLSTVYCHFSILFVIGFHVENSEFSPAVCVTTSVQSLVLHTKILLYLILYVLFLGQFTFFSFYLLVG